MKHIADLMRRLEWETTLAPVLAAEWGVSESRIEDLSAEASRIVRAEVMDPAVVSVTVSSALSTVVKDALADGDRRSVIQAADTWTKITGARAPERHQEVPISPEDAARILEQAAAEHAALKGKK